MEKLLEILKNESIKTALDIQKSDFQYKSLEKLNKNLNSIILLDLVLANSIICYQLSSSGEAYWEEFSNYFSNFNWKNFDIINELKLFIVNSKWNKRFVDTKAKRLDKLKPFLDDFSKSREILINDFTNLQKNLAKTMNQKTTDKTIVFAIKMLGYAISIYYKKDIVFPFEISIPIDSRLTNLYEKYNTNSNLKIDEFYDILSKKLNIPPLSLDAILWVNYEKFIN